MDNFDSFFSDDPWANVNGPSYPQGQRLYLHDERFWVSIDDENRLLFFIHAKGGGSVRPLENLAGLDISIEEQSSGEYRLVCRLTDDDPDIAAKFQTVAKDVAYYCSQYSGSQLFMKTQERIKSWANFLRPSRRGLTRSQFIGFFGELFVLSEYLTPALSAASAVRSWVGPESKKQDFTFDSFALEVKTTASGDPNVVRVSSLDQLDRVTDQLFLLRLVISPANDGLGVTLQDLYLKCLSDVEHDIPTESLFIQRATQLYGKASESQLADRYAVTNMSVYEVTDDFPCLTRHDVGNAILDANYQIAVSALDKHKISEDLGDILNNE